MVLSLRKPRPDAVDALLHQQQQQELSYPEVGATRAVFPGGYRHIRHTVDLGRGPEVFARATEGLARWQAHVGGGVSVHPPDAPVEAGVTVILTVPLAALYVTVACRVVYVVEEAGRWGFAYGTLPHHLIEGEEAFVVERDGEGAVRFGVSAFLRPRSLAARAIGPLIGPLDRLLGRRYLVGLRQHVAERA